MSGYKRVNFYDLCRLCATYQKCEKTNIFEEQGRKMELQDKIQICLSLQVCQDDILPKVVCSKCLENLEKSYVFRQECYTSETMLLGYFKNFRNTEEFKKSGKVYIKDISQTESSSKPTGNEDLVSNVFPQDISSFYTLHVPPVSTIARIIQPPPLTSLNHDTTQENKVIDQPQIVYKPRLIKTEPPGAISITVNANGEIISTTPIIDITHSPKTTKETDENLSNYDEKLPIYNENLLISVPYGPVDINLRQDELSPIYGPQFEEVTILAKNLEKTLSCSVCMRTFKRREHLYQHAQLHTGFRPYKCENCSKSYIRKEHLMRHLTAHSGEKKFACEICKRSFSRHDNLLKHKKTHDRPNYKCGVCQRKFALEHFYLAHKTTHIQ